MIEKTILDYLDAKLSVGVYMEVPEDPPQSFVVIEKTGSGEENGVYSATLAVQSYAQTMLEAATLNESAKTAMRSAQDECDIFAVRLNSDYNFTNTATKRYRYQAIFDIYF